MGHFVDCGRVHGGCIGEEGLSKCVVANGETEEVDAGCNFRVGSTPVSDKVVDGGPKVLSLCLREVWEG
jgi:hypothetical protein